MSAVVKVLVCFALKEEAGAFQKIATGKGGAAILITGIGRKNAERSVREALTGSTPAFVLTCGFAGGLDPELEIGDVVFSTTDAKLGETLPKHGAHPAMFFCASHMAILAAQKAELRRTTGADVVEMESEAIQAVCRERGVPCATVRVISDTAQQDLPLDFNQLSNPDWSLHYGRLALAVAKSPGRIPALVRLQRNSRLAAQRLAEVLAQIIWQG